MPFEEIDGNKLIEKFDFLVENEKDIKKILKRKIPLFRKQAEGLYKAVMTRLKKLDEENITGKEKCSGCSACASVCPKNAINIEPDEEGFLFPVIDEKKCVRCKICRQVCPNNKSYNYEYDDLQAYACKNLSDNERLKSSSGGVFSLLAKSILEENGCVFGAIFENNDIRHIKIENKDDLEKLRGSKYVESTIGDSYVTAKQELDNGRKVLFSGTSCQIEGLKSFLGKEYGNLICVSVVCHGVPSKKVFSRYLRGLEMKHNDKILKINFRNKDGGWKNYQIEYIFRNKSIKKNTRKDKYMIGFLKNYYLRQSCYDCDYRLYEKNTADVILGDFWGIEKEYESFDDDKGVSAIIINSEKGAELFSKIENKTISKKVSVEQIARHNPCLTESVALNESRFEFFNLFDRTGFDFAVDYFVEKNEIREMKNNLRQIQGESQQTEKQVQIQQLRNKLRETEDHLRQEKNRFRKMQEQHQQMQSELLSIIDSRKWRLITKMAAVFNSVFPHGSLRRKFLRMGYKGFARVFKRIISFVK